MLGKETAVVVLSAAASGTLFLSLLTGATVAPLIGYFVQLPVMFCGLALGLPRALLASAGAMLLVGGLGGVVAGAVFAVLAVVPCLIVVRQALLWRQDQAAVAEWYPAGRIVCELAVVLGAVTMLVVASFGPAPGELEQALRQWIASGRAAPGGNAALMPSEATLSIWAAWLPAVAAGSWLLMTIVNTLAAQALAATTGMARRPSPELASLSVPAWCAPCFLAALALAAGSSGVVERASLIGGFVLAMPLLFQGLAVVHVLARRWPQRRLILAGFYLLMLLFGLPLIPIVVAIGVVEGWAGLRRRIA